MDPTTAIEATRTYVLPRCRPRNSPVGRALLTLLSQRGAIYCTAAEMADVLQQYAEPAALATWPASPKLMAGVLRRLRRGLVAEGFEVWVGRFGKSRRRYWAIWPRDADCSLADVRRTFYGGPTVAS
jgi:hypothetical protein